MLSFQNRRKNYYCNKNIIYWHGSVEVEDISINQTLTLNYFAWLKHSDYSNLTDTGVWFPLSITSSVLPVQFDSVLL